MKRIVIYIIMLAIPFLGCSFKNGVKAPSSDTTQYSEWNESDLGRENEDDKVSEEELQTYTDKLEEIRQDILVGEDEYKEDKFKDVYNKELALDRKIAKAVEQLAITLHPGYKYKKSTSAPGKMVNWLTSKLKKKYRLGFIDISDINQGPTSKLHKYISEKTLMFSFLRPEISGAMDIVEHFTLKDVQRILFPGKSRLNILNDRKATKQLGKLRDLDIIETGTLTLSSGYVDLNLKMVETRTGRIIAVASVKMAYTNTIKNWLNDYHYTPEEDGLLK